jgi:hypothetical protein
MASISRHGLTGGFNSASRRPPAVVTELASAIQDNRNDLELSRALAARMPKFEEAMVYDRFEAKGPKFFELQRDAELIQFYADTFGKPDNPAELSRHEASLAMTMIKHGDDPDPAVQERLQALQEKFKDVFDNRYMRENCYTAAVGRLEDQGKVPLFMGATPGEAAMGIAASGKTDPSSIISGAIADGLSYAGNDPAKLNPPEGMRVVAVYFKPEAPGESPDFHWVKYAQSPGGELMAVQKLGVQGHESEVLSNGTTLGAERAQTYGHGYKIGAYFYVPNEGIKNLGLYGHGVANGYIDPKENPDVAYTSAATSGEFIKGRPPIDPNPEARLAALQPKNETPEVDSPQANVPTHRRPQTAQMSL